MANTAPLDREVFGSAWVPPAGLDRTEDGRPVFVVGERRYVEVPLGPEDAQRFLGEIRLEMTAADFRAFTERHRANLSPAVLWRLGVGPMPVAPKAPVRGERARSALRQLLQAA